MARHRINRIAETQVLIAGSSLAGVAAALAAARSGFGTVLAMGTTSPGSEIGSAMGAWLTEAEAELLPDDIRSALLDRADPQAGPSGEPEYILDQTGAVTHLENLLLDAGVTLYYDLRPVGLLSVPTAAGAPGAAGALFGGEFGTAAVTAPLVVDCTADGMLTRTTGFGAWIDSGEAERCSACFLTDTEHRHGQVPFAENMTVGRRGPIAEFRFTADDDEPETSVRRTIAAHMAGWNRTHPGLRFRIERAGDECLSLPARRLDADGVAGPAATGIHGFLCIGPAADAALRGDGYFDVRTRYVMPAYDRMCSEIEHGVSAFGRGEYRLLQPDSREDGPCLPDDCSIVFGDPSFDEPGVDEIEVDLPPVPVILSSELVVAGGGTSGAQAAVQAGLRGVRTVCIEGRSDLGGVSTVGGVPAYWYGRRTPFFKRLHARIKETVRDREIPVAFALMHFLRESGADLILRTPAVGAAVDGHSVRSVLCATRDGLAAVAGRMFIDATGNGDIAAWAGAPYTYGSERDEITMWCSFGSFHRGRDEASRQYMSVTDRRSPRDTARGIIAGRRMGGIYGRGRYVQHTLVSRESRHIAGTRTVNYHDVMMGRAFPDAVMWFKSNVDIKGIASSRAALCGYIEKSFNQNYQASVPLGALLPRGIANLVVAGKAFSATHDALSMARMQPDLMSLGAVAALIAESVLRGGGAPDTGAVDLPALQEELEALGILLPGDLPFGPLDERVPPDDDGLSEIVERLSVKPAESSEWARILSRPEGALRHLDRRDVITVEWNLRQIDHLAATLGDTGGNDRLFERLDRMLEYDTLPGIGLLDARHEMPDHGFAPEPVYLVNALAQTRDPRLAVRLARIAGLLDIDPEVSDHRFSYIHSIAYAAERLATREAGEAAAELMGRPPIRDRILRRSASPPADPRECADYVGERFAYLGLCLARAAARCGLSSGYSRLADYTGEIRLYLARSAREELAELLETDRRFDRGAWLREIGERERNGTLPVRPFLRILD